MFKFHIKLLLIHLIILSKITAEICPKYCTCDLFQNLNRADCSSQRLISTDVGVPSGVEVLNLNQNDINVLDSSAFEGLSNLLNLSLSSNGIGTIYLDAFEPLQYIKYIDLSNNRLETFDARIFESCKNLREVNLSGNKFMSLKNEPILKSQSLHSLSLSAAQINHIYPQIFSELPQLSILDLSGNLLITVNLKAFQTLTNLKVINFSGNRWLCDNDLRLAVDMLKKSGVQVLLDACPEFAITKKKNHMFEKMIMAPPVEIEETTFKPFTNREIDLVWKNRFLFDCNQRDKESVCVFYNECQNMLNELLEMKTDKEHDLPKMYTNDDLNIVMLIGIFLGIAAMFAIISTFFCLKRCYLAMKRPQRRIFTLHPGRTSNNRRGAGEEREPHTILIGRQSTPAARRNLIDTNVQSDFSTFITRLFRRRVPRRSIRQHVFHRLSSINNRLSQHFRDNSTPTNTEPDTEQFIVPTVEQRPIINPINLWDNSDRIEATVNANVQQQNQTVVNRPETQTVVNRPETPPPSYSDCFR